MGNGQGQGRAAPMRVCACCCSALGCLSLSLSYGAKCLFNASYMDLASGCSVSVCVIQLIFHLDCASWNATGEPLVYVGAL